MARIGGRDVATYDIGVLGAGLVVFISSFLPWYGLKVGNFNGTANGWHSHFLAWFPILLCIAIAAVVAGQVFGRVRMPAVGPIQPALLLTLVSALALLLILIRWASLPDVPAYVTVEAKSGARAGLFLGLFGALALTAFNALRLVSGGGQAAPAAAYPYGQQQPGWPRGQQPGTWPQAQQPGTWPQGQQPQPGTWQQGGPGQGQGQQGGWQQYPPQQYPLQQYPPQQGQQYPPQQGQPYPPQQGGWPQNPQG